MAPRWGGKGALPTLDSGSGETTPRGALRIPHGSTDLESGMFNTPHMNRLPRPQRHTATPRLACASSSAASQDTADRHP